MGAEEVDRELVEVLWVFVHDLRTHRDEDFFTADLRQTALRVI